jgi:AraC-like DNA-binding protein
MMTCENDYLHRVVLNDDPDGKDGSRYDSAGMLRLHCEYGSGEPAGLSVAVWSLGRLGMMNGRLAHMSLAPLSDCGDTWLDLTLVRTGAMYIEQGGQARRIGAGEIVLVESSHAYRQTFYEQTDIIALRFPVHALKEHGLWYNLRGLITPDMSAVDTRAIGELVMSIAAQRGETSMTLRRRQGDQLLELIDLLIDDPVALPRAGSGDTTLFRAKHFIAQNLRNPELTVSLIAAAVHVSVAHLGRIFRVAGQTVMRYVWESRLELSVDMLRRSQGRARITDIAHRCGFSTPSHFSRAFRDRYGISPRNALAAQGCESSPELRNDVPKVFEFLAPTSAREAAAERIIVDVDRVLKTDSRFPDDQRHGTSDRDHLAHRIGADRSTSPMTG